MMVFVQVLLGAGMAVVYGFFYPRVSHQTAPSHHHRDPHAGADPARLVLVPTTVCHQKVDGTFEWVWSLPVPRSAQGASMFLLYTLLALPGMVLALVVSSSYYGVRLSISAVLVPGACRAR